ncbi:type II toxin-antitoxin system RelE/ParE family toxin [Methylomonas fluvii]|uniref:Type II toxin-antitoxin system RelE/ParE family toxin n=1 Tax=Methylomonas fluvii TaxID=1854564 RepID=A0ABR9DL98_9GAMM|nr:type II toxin-antitoxin system RelE/ParE family toxin [Methylomonas fluvii]MBD9363715.1 type II toxin-antitoxin system RelE/ParE family toxin [Methylomonas fluvii]
MNYRFHPGAQHEHLEIIGFYESRQPGLGVAYLAEFESFMISVANMPGRYRVERKPNIRVVSLLKFPYKIIFRDTHAGVQVLAVSHKKRRPDYWLGRL